MRRSGEDTGPAQSTRGGDLAARRRRAMQALIHHHEAVTVEELGRVFGVSLVTVRKDLEALAAAGAVRRFHGGALSVVTRSNDVAPADEPR